MARNMKDASPKYQAAYDRAIGTFNLKVQELKNENKYTKENLENLFKNISAQVSKWVTNNQVITPEESTAIRRELLELLNEEKTKLKQLQAQQESELNNFSNEGEITNWSKIVEIRNNLIGKIVQDGDESTIVGTNNCECDVLYKQLKNKLYELEKNNEDDRKEEQLIKNTLDQINQKLSTAFNTIKKYQETNPEFNKKISKENINKYFYSYILKRKEDYKNAINGLAKEVLMTNEDKQFTDDPVYERIINLVETLIKKEVKLSEEINLKNEEDIKKSIRSKVVDEINSNEKYHNWILTLIHRFGKGVINGQDKNSITNKINSFIETEIGNKKKENKKIENIKENLKSSVTNEPIGKNESFFEFKINNETSYYNENDKEDMKKLVEEFKKLYNYKNYSLNDMINGHELKDLIIAKIDSCATFSKAKNYFILRNNNNISSDLFRKCKNTDSKLDAEKILDEIFDKGCLVIHKMNAKDDGSQEIESEYFSNYEKVDEELMKILLLKISDIKYYKNPSEYISKNNKSYSFDSNRKLLVKFKDGITIECLHNDNKSQEEVIKEIIKLKKSFKEE